jgi:pimeloyl-ACP methyl ester carboxylesterase
MENSSNPAFVLIHGAWHNRHTWDKVIPLLAEQGYAALAIDLPGAGDHAKAPDSFFERPLDQVAFAEEISPNAGVTQEERNQATLDAIHEATTMGNGRVILVGHSLGGITLSPVAQLVPEGLQAVVYLTAMMLPNGMSGGEIIGSESMASSGVPSLFMANPEVVGAMRMDTRSDDTQYLAAVREAFYADVTDDDFAFILSNLHCDEPAQVVGVPSPVTADKFGTIDRHYIRCTQDRAVPIGGQDHIISIVDEQMGNKTTVHTLATSHSPFLSAPAELTEILVSVAQ